MVEGVKEESSARAEYSTAVLECFVTIEQLQMGVSTIATALALLCRASFFQPSLEKWAWQAGR